MPGRSQCVHSGCRPRLHPDRQVRADRPADPIGQFQRGVGELRGVPGAHFGEAGAAGRPDPAPPGRLLGRDLGRSRCASRHAFTLLPPIGSAPRNGSGEG